MVGFSFGIRGPPGDQIAAPSWTEPAFRLRQIHLGRPVDFDISKGDQMVIRPYARQVRSAYPLYGGIQNYK
jgi:hypothetical protein